MNFNFSYKYKNWRIEKLSSVGCFSLNDWIEIEKLSRDSNAEIRLRVSELLGYHHNSKSEKVLLSMLSDEDELVRAEVCDSLSFSSNPNIQERIIGMCLFDNSELVRGYATIAMGDIHLNIDSKTNKSIKHVFISVLSKDTEWVQIAALRSLVLTNNPDYEMLLINKIGDNDYKNRRFAVSACEELFNNKKINNIKNLHERLIKQELVETVSCVKESIRLLIQLIKNDNTGDGTAEDRGRFSVLTKSK